VTTTTRKAQCRYTQKFNRCPNPAVDSVGEVLLCMEHLGRTIELLRNQGFRIIPPWTPIDEPDCDTPGCCLYLHDGPHMADPKGGVATFHSNNMMVVSS